MSEVQETFYYQGKPLRSLWVKAENTWYFSLVDIVGIVSTSRNPRNYWKYIKRKLIALDKMNANSCKVKKLISSDGKFYETDVATATQAITILRRWTPRDVSDFKQWLKEKGESWYVPPRKKSEPDNRQ